VAGRTVPDLEEVAGEIQRMGRRALAVTADVRKQEDVEAMVARAMETFSKIDILVYNSGVIWVEKVADTSDEVWEQTLSVNLLGAARAIREVLNQGKMLERKQGRIIVVASESGKVGEIGLGAYTASKHGVLGLIRCLGMELGPEGITANAVCPGLVRTQMADHVVARLGEIYGVAPDELDAWSKEFDPQKRIAEPEDVADVVAFLASDASGSMTGQALNLATKIP
jgi:NAD(P)-dependent dehydrogenase (short-subunit alcohol dehydrogenase family)